MLLPSPDFDQVRALVESGRSAPREGHVIPAEAEPRCHHAADDRRMILAAEASTSTRDRVAPPAWKKRHRTAPDTFTRSPARQVRMLRLRRGIHAVHGTESTR